MQALLNFGRDILYNQNFQGNMREVMDSSAIRLIRDTFINFGLLALGLAALLVNPIYLFLFKGENAIILPLSLPFIDNKSDLGYISNAAFHLAMFCSLGTALLGLEALLSIILNNLQTATDVAVHNMKEMGDMEKFESLECARRLRNLLLQIHDIDE